MVIHSRKVFETNERLVDSYHIGAREFAVYQDSSLTIMSNQGEYVHRLGRLIGSGSMQKSCSSLIVSYCCSNLNSSSGPRSHVQACEQWATSEQQSLVYDYDQIAADGRWQPVLDLRNVFRLWMLTIT